MSAPTNTTTNTTTPAPDPRKDLQKELRALICEPEMIEIISKVVAAQFSDTLRKEIATLKDKLTARDDEVRDLREKVDDLEQHGRRDAVRVTGVPETAEEDTDQLVVSLAQSIGVTVTRDDIDRSHRIGPKPSADGPARAILVRLTSHRHKRRLMGAKKKLGQADLRKAFPGLQWTSRGQSSQSSQSSRATPRVYLNDDLTRAPAEVAAMARDLKRRGKVDGTWVRDGAVFVLRQGTVRRITTKRALQAL